MTYSPNVPSLSVTGDLQLEDIRKVYLAEFAEGAERLITHVLYARTIEPREIVVIGMVEVEAIRDRNIDAGRAVMQVDGQVGRVRQQLVDGRHH